MSACVAGTRALVVGALLLSTAAKLTAEGPASVCDVLSNLDHYRGKLITIAGTLSGGDRHGWYIEDTRGSHPCVGVEKHGHRWPPAIAVVQFVAGAEIEDGPASFESDGAEIRNMLLEPKRLVAGHDDLAITVTAVGELRSRKGITISLSEDGWYAGDGYGQSGQYPALLVLKSLTVAKVVKADRTGRQ